MIGLWVVGGIVVGLFLMKRSADRFAAAKRRAGEWDENGPKHPTEPSYTTVGRVRILNVAANLKPEVDADGDVEELRERDLPGIAELVQRILELLLDGSQPSHEALRGQVPTPGAVVHDGCFSAVIIDTFGARWPRDAEIISLRLIEPLMPTESSEESAT